MSIRNSSTADPLPYVDVVVEPGSDRLDLHFHGEIDIATHAILARHLEALEMHRYTVVDLHLDRLGFCDSHGVVQILTFIDSARAAGCTVTLDGASPQVARMLTLLRTTPAA